MGDSPKWVKSKKTEKKNGEKKKEEERLNNGDNNGQATHGARKHAWRTQATWANCDFRSFTEFVHGVRLRGSFLHKDLWFQD